MVLESKITDIQELQKKAQMIKVKAAELCIKKGKGHITSALSCAEIVTVLYYAVMDISLENKGDKDRFIMSKNHGSIITYPVLFDLGFISETCLNSYQDDDSSLGTHSKIVIPGIDFSGGSLGIGLGVACGYTLAAQVDKKDYLTFCLVGDCECHEGSIWESIMFAGHNKLHNLIMIIDQNGEGCTDFIEKMIPLAPFRNKLEAFGWEFREVQNGHSIQELMDVFRNIRERNTDKPLCISAKTVKGNGIKSMEHIPWMHGQTPKGADGELALKQLKDIYEFQ
ncbi:MAG: hypothetical protein LBE13_05280 [Bacteroidales bacterium]|jgi:transketolase|nr:hypothetical protein [Bacteroidales bacterium]